MEQTSWLQAEIAVRVEWWEVRSASYEWVEMWLVTNE